MSARAYDCIVIGAGHNGLVCGAYLARSGRSVLVVEAAPEVGGASVTREFAPGFRVSACAHLLHLMPDSICRDLGLKAHGLKLLGDHLPTTAVCGDGAAMPIDPHHPQALAQHCPADAASLVEFNAQLHRLASSLQPLFAAPPPRLGTHHWRDRLALVQLAWRVRRLRRADQRELLRIGGMCVQDLLDERFETPLLKGALGFDAVLGSNAGPRSPGTVMTWLYRLTAGLGTAGELTQPAGGLGGLSEALARAARSVGVTIRTGAPVEHILVRDDRARGVVLRSGEEIAARCVISSADPKTTFLKLLGAQYLDAGFVRRVGHLRTQGLTAKLHVALDRLPRFPGVTEAALRGRLLLAPSLEYLERAFNHTKYHECSAAPALEITVPSLADPALAPAGQHVLSAVVQYVPYRLAAGWEQERTRVCERLVQALARCAPGIEQSILATQLLTPQDIEREFRISGGHWHHAELALDQMLMLRPIPGAAQYRTPVDGLYLCGAGCHPGGGVMGLAGRNAAHQVLREAA